MFGVATREEVDDGDDVTVAWDGVVRAVVYKE